MTRTTFRIHVQKKPLLLCLLGILLCVNSIHCQDFRKPPRLQVSIQPSLGFKSGSMGEHLFNMGGYGKPVDFAPAGGRQISFLQWDIHAMILAELEVGFQYKSFYAQVSGEAGLGSIWGKMDDYDWNSTKGHQTHFSTHTNGIDWHCAVGGLVGWELSSVDRRLKIVPMVGWSWQRTAMTAQDGYRQYVPDQLQETTTWTDSLEKVYFDGAVISYEHEVFQVDCILRITYNHSPRLHFHLDGSIHPIIGAFGYDTHILRDLQFLDYDMKGELGFGAALTVGYQVVPKQWLILKVDYIYMPVVVGQAYLKNAGQQYYYPDASSRGGASHWFVGVSLGWKFNVFR